MTVVTVMTQRQHQYPLEESGTHLVFGYEREPLAQHALHFGRGDAFLGRVNPSQTKGDPKMTNHKLLAEFMDDGTDPRAQGFRRSMTVMAVVTVGCRRFRPPRQRELFAGRQPLRIFGTPWPAAVR
jgi:hypothetical protein